MKILKLFIDDQVVDTPEAASIRSRLGLQAQVVHDIREVYKTVLSAADPVQIGKEVLFLTLNRGGFVRKCPGTRFYTCCGYKILHIGTYCLMDCAYCILQSYFHPPVLQYFVNRQDLLKELEILFAEQTVARIGTGEFTDSMIWEAWTDLSKLLIPAFAAQSRAVLELKTKTTAIEKLKDLPHNRKTIVAWSLNTERIIRTEERGTASLTARLEAAARCESWGYPVAFHFDPIIVYGGCEAEYRTAIHKLLSRVSPEKITWISLGAFRFMPDLKAIIQRRFPNSKIVYGEFISGVDAKMRYFKPIRIDIYRKMVSWIREMAPDVTIYFCMEDDEVWWKSLGFIPSERGGLSHMLDISAVKHCGLSGRID